jgi:hypothetical protein
VPHLLVPHLIYSSCMCWQDISPSRYISHECVWFMGFQIAPNTVRLSAHFMEAWLLNVYEFLHIPYILKQKRGTKCDKYTY